VQAEELIQKWEDELGPLKKLRSDLYGPGGRLEGVRKIISGDKGGGQVQDDVRAMTRDFRNTLTLGRMRSLLGLLTFSAPSNLTNMALLGLKSASRCFHPPSHKRQDNGTNLWVQLVAQTRRSLQRRYYR